MSRIGTPKQKADGGADVYKEEPVPGKGKAGHGGEPKTHVRAFKSDADKLTELTHRTGKSTAQLIHEMLEQYTAPVIL